MSTGDMVAIVVAGVLMLPAATAAGGRPAGDYEKEIRHWREEREARLKADGGWLTVAGLYWLREGDNRFGTDPGNAFVLPKSSAPAEVGVFTLRDGHVTARLDAGVTASLDGHPAQTGREIGMRPDTAGEPDVLTLNALSMHVIQRGDRYGIRLKDLNSAARRTFTGLRWYPIQEPYRVQARFEPYDPPRTIPIPTILGTTDDMPCPGAAVFTLNGRKLRLDPVIEEPGADELFFIFADQTNGKETYPSGRFLYAAFPKDGTLILDFNKAYNPPCAFTPYATCPLPPPQNRLPVRIEAGELSYGHH
ncbi:MAG TPA: DUF1684 domain-containing protein [Candidatus Polarisedimenticolia bacterium]|nr:DUF1684 domain-containing protein [Candidatus Polarisedimenticolia bacterium]